MDIHSFSQQQTSAYTFFKQIAILFFKLTIVAYS